VDELDASVEETVESKQRHILTRSELRTLSDEVMQLVGMLDGQPLPLRAGAAVPGGVEPGEACGGRVAGRGTPEHAGGAAGADGSSDR
jgi:hypothetical protein